MFRFMYCLTVVGLVNLTPVINAAPLQVELTDTEKAQIRKATLVRDSAEPTIAPRPVSPGYVPVRPVAAPMPERLVRAIAAHKELTLAVQRLLAKRSEIERWDGPAQEKFVRAFGSNDDKLRQAVLARIEQQIQESSRGLALLADSIRFEFYVSLNKKSPE